MTPRVQQFDSERPEKGWHPATPLPFFGGSIVTLFLREHLVCECKRRFKGRNARRAYEEHWQQIHAPEVERKWEAEDNVRG